MQHHGLRNFDKKLVEIAELGEIVSPQFCGFIRIPSFSMKKNSGEL